MNATLLQIQFFYHAAEEVYTSSARLDHVDPPAAQNGYYESGKAGAGPKIQPYPTIILRSVKQELSAVCNMARPNMVPRRAGDHILMLHFFEKTGDIQFQPCPCFTWNIKPIIERSEEHTSELQSLMRISYAVFCL